MSIRRTLAAALVAAAAFSIQAYGFDVAAARDAFARQRFGIFIHWGLYANYAQGEWYLNHGGLEEAAYARMMHGFCPSKFDAGEWVRIVKGAGAKYITITSRHHDGFSLWPTKADDGYNIANTPFGRDILGELAEACRKEGIQLNFYYSLLDWHRPDYPTRPSAAKQNARGDYASYKRFMMAQIGELLENYHPGCIWFDGEWDHCEKDPVSKRYVKGDLDWGLDEIYDLIHAKGALVANNNHMPIRDSEDIQLFERDLPGENASGLSTGQPVAHSRPIEQCDVIQHNVWGYRIGERKFRSAEDVVAMVVRAAAKDTNLLMNVGPDGSGQFPRQAVEVLKRVGAWFAKNGESVYGTTAGGAGDGKTVASTRKGRTLYLHFLEPGVREFSFRTEEAVRSVSRLDGDPGVSVGKTPSGETKVSITRSAGDGFDIVVKVVFAG